MALLFALAPERSLPENFVSASVGEDVAYRVIPLNLVPDHWTIAEFRARHEATLASLFSEVLSLCQAAGTVNVGVLAVYGTKVHANASNMANRDYRQVALEIVNEAHRIDREEDELYGDQRGDELPEHQRTPEGRRAALKEAKRRLERGRAAEREGIADDPRTTTAKSCLGRGRWSAIPR